MSPRLETIRTKGLGDSTFVLSHEGSAVVVDPQRDFDRVTDVLERLGADPRAILETHIHNDYVSGGLMLAKASGAELVMPAGSAPVFRHRAAFHMEDIEAGSLTIRPIHTPGHTPEHISYLVLIDGKAHAVFSGGSLLVQSAGRSDLLGHDRAETLARLQFHSVNRLAVLPGDVILCPTHGAGSFCVSSAAGGAVSTIGQEVETNPVLAHVDEETFVKAQLADLVPFPAYYRHMAPANLTGSESLPTFRPPHLTDGEFDSLDIDVVVVDARPAEEFASGHLPGSLGIGGRSDFGVWTGWVVPFDSPIVLVANPDQDTEDLTRQLARIGFDRVVGVIRDLDQWARPLTSYPTVGVDEFADSAMTGGQILDARAPNEWEDGVIPGSILSYAPDVASEGIPDAERPVFVACETGYRATIAASRIEAMGLAPVVLTGA
ncbi:MAG: MBL fold metallo-hydrolase, partial [Acidimicrobiia bacterium]|nr:MBL fold metallo-hydrolase [Acidimicrobiia bacterium]